MPRMQTEIYDQHILQIIHHNSRAINTYRSYHSPKTSNLMYPNISTFLKSFYRNINSHKLKILAWKIPNQQSQLEL